MATGSAVVLWDRLPTTAEPGEVAAPDPEVEAPRSPAAAIYFVDTRSPIAWAGSRGGIAPEMDGYGQIADTVVVLHAARGEVSATTVDVTMLQHPYRTPCDCRVAYLSEIGLLANLHAEDNP